VTGIAPSAVADPRFDETAPSANLGYVFDRCDASTRSCRSAHQLGDLRADPFFDENGHMGNVELHQRLVAILAADVVGYSRLMSVDEHATVAALDLARSAFRQHIEVNHGRVVDMAGDSVLAVFETATGAVMAAMAIQDQLASLFADVPEDHRMRFRVGVHLGDVIEKSDGTVYGDGVNIAARLEGLAEAGGVTVSDMVFGAVRDRINAGFQDVGEHSVKNIARPMRAYRVHAAPVDTAGSIEQAKTTSALGEIGQPIPQRSSTAAILGALLVASAVIAVGMRYFWPRGVNHSEHDQVVHAAPASAAITPGASAAPTVLVPPMHSVAVLPFVNMSGDAKQDYFSDGMSEELLNSLSQVRDLHVAARTSSFSFKGSNAKIGEIARQLNVGAVLEGSVRKDGNRVRITTQLIDASTGFHLWSQTYDRNLKSILSLQTEVATAVTNALQATLLTNDATAIELGGTRTPGALDAYLRGQKFWGAVSDRQALRGWIADFDEAIRIDPTFAKAYVSKSYCLTQLARGSTGSVARRIFEQAQAAARKALSLAPELGEAHSALAIALAFSFDLSQAQVAIEQALARAPGDARVLGDAAWFMAATGDTQRAIAMARRAVELDPLNALANAKLGWVLAFGAHRYREGITVYDRALSIRPDLGDARGSLGVAYMMLGENEQVLKTCTSDTTPELVCRALVYHRLNRPADAKAALDALMTRDGDDDSYQYAEIYTDWGDTRQGLHWLAIAYRLRDPGMIGLKTDALLDPLRKEPEFQEIERKMKFPA
jgi:adenylate cyclase